MATPKYPKFQITDKDGNRTEIDVTSFSIGNGDKLTDAEVEAINKVLHQAPIEINIKLKTIFNLPRWLNNLRWRSALRKAGRVN